MTTYETMTLMIAFGVLIITLLNLIVQMQKKK
ncbi:putative holin-like toxin [Paenibacillus sp. N3.4]|nr:putative holin-like toxin [Paenibacillus sp. N3.4]